MATVNVYLTFNGNCEEAFEFYKSAFGVEFKDFNKFGEMPSQEGMPELSDDLKQRVMHVNLPISAETTLMGSDILPSMGTSFTVGDNFSVSIGAKSKEEADALFAKLSAGGKITMPLNTTFWGAYFGMWEDKFGVNWMINYDLPK